MLRNGLGPPGILLGVLEAVLVEVGFLEQKGIVTFLRRVEFAGSFSTMKNQVTRVGVQDY